MTYKKYESYKDSEIEWIGEIPEHWEVIKGKHIFKIYGNSLNENNVYLENNDNLIPILYYKVEDMNFDKNSLFMSKNINYKYTDVISPKIPKYSILIPKRGAAIATNKVKINFEKCYIDSNIMALSTKQNPKFLSYFILSRGLWDIADVSSVPQINNKHINYLSFCLPNIKEQKQIANFLDKRTSDIDENIAKNKELINLLEEKKTALINQVVTKGLNPNVPMKDSGIEWIGEIPEHWDVINLKKCCEKITDGSHFSPPTTSEGKYYITVSNVLNDKIDFENAPKISIEDYNSLKNNGCEPKEGDVLLSKDGTIGKCIIVDKTKFVILSSLGLLRPNQLIHSEYLRYYLLSDINIKQMNSHIRGSAIKRLTIKLIKELLLILPPLNEQETIINYLNPKLNNIDETISKIKENIDLLDEYKTSLIHHVVTGKVDVRGEVL